MNINMLEIEINEANDLRYCEQIENIIKDIIEDETGNIPSLGDKTNDIGLDACTLLSVVVKLEKLFNISICYFQIEYVEDLIFQVVTKLERN